MKPKRKVGRPPKFESAEVLREKIKEYFVWCEGELLTDPNTGRPIITKQGLPVYKGVHPPTMAGLANALDMSRVTLKNYSGKKEFEEIISRAKRLVERYTEEQLIIGKNPNGAQFSLQNNFYGWKDEKEISISAAEDEEEAIMAEVRRKMAQEMPQAGGAE